jgi:hypothetical protein
MNYQLGRRNKPLPLSARKPWTGASVSLVMHGLLIGLIIWGANRPKNQDPRSASNRAQVQPITMAYIQPPPIPDGQRKIEQPISRPAPDAIQAQDDARAKVREEVDEVPAEVAAAPPPEEEETPPETMASTPPPPDAPAEQPTMESEAQRLFGRPKLQTQPDPNQMGARLGTLSEEEAEARRSCVPKPKTPKAQIEMAELIGRVWFDEAHTRPLSGAYLQMIGTPYSAYSDHTGRYRLLFDASLVDECRTQYVRVVAAGYSGKNLVLGLGPGVNDIVMGR